MLVANVLGAGKFAPDRPIVQESAFIAADHQASTVGAWLASGCSPMGDLRRMKAAIAHQDWNATQAAAAKMRSASSSAPPLRRCVARPRFASLSMLFVLGIEGTGHHVVRNILEASANDSGWAVLDSSVQPHYHTETALKVRQLVITLFHKPNNISPARLADALAPLAAAQHKTLVIEASSWPFGSDTDPPHAMGWSSLHMAVEQLSSLMSVRILALTRDPEQAAHSMLRRFFHYNHNSKRTFPYTSREVEHRIAIYSWLLLLMRLNLGCLNDRCATVLTIPYDDLHDQEQTPARVANLIQMPLKALAPHWRVIEAPQHAYPRTQHATAMVQIHHYACTGASRYEAAPPPPLPPPPLRTASSTLVTEAVATKPCRTAACAHARKKAAVAAHARKAALK